MAAQALSAGPVLLTGMSGSARWVELLFPPVARGPSTDLANPEYSNFCYWREPLAAVDLDALA